MLFNKNLEKDNCGYGLICNRNGKPSRKVVEKSIDALSSMAHRGGVGFDEKTGKPNYHNEEITLKKIERTLNAL